MTFPEAKKLHNEDEVIVKKTGESLCVVSVKVDSVFREVWVTCDDGNTYRHSALK